MTVNKKPIFIVSILAFLAVLFLVLAWPSIYEYQCKNRIFDDMEKSFASVEAANIRIIAVTGNEDDGMGYSASSSGVIIEHDDDTYYALTAGHVVDKTDADHYIVATSVTPTYKEYKKDNGITGHIPPLEYYSLMPEVNVEYMYDKADLAVISFQYPEKLEVVELTHNKPIKGDRIAAAGNPDDIDGGFIHSFGKITSAKEITFEADDGRPADRVLKHNAYEEPGSSGSAIYNEEMELAGINIGGGRDIFGRFRHGAMIPSDQITECLQKWNKQ